MAGAAQPRSMARPLHSLVAAGSSQATTVSVRMAGTIGDDTGNPP